MVLDNHGSLRSVFWIDARSRVTYSIFDYVLVFDVTYKTNKFRIIFAPFTDVNHQ